MRTLPAFSTFKLIQPINNAPAGATGKLKRLDSEHVALFFDDNKYPDLVFDVNDTAPQVRAAIALIANPSMTDPPRWARTAATIAAAFLLGWVLNPPPIISNARAATVDYVLDFVW